jgi:ribosomal protein S18 acetylase RimI-like enzyme
MDQLNESIIPDPHIRRVDVRSDLDAIAALIETCFAETLDQDGRAYVKQLRRSAEDARRLSWAVEWAEENSLPIKGFVWVEDHHIVGNLTLIPMRKQNLPVTLIANVAVLPEYRRQKIAQKLTVCALKYLAGKPGQVWLQVREDNPAAGDLYRKLGFLERARRTTWHHYSGDPIPPVRSDTLITPCWHADWKSQLSLLQNYYPDEVNWNLSVNFTSFKAGFLSHLFGFLPGDTNRSWAWRQNGRLMGTLTWEAARTWTDNLWLGSEPADVKAAISVLLPYALNAIQRSTPQAVNFPSGTAEDEFLKCGFKKHYTLIWMELPSKSLHV